MRAFVSGCAGTAFGGEEVAFFREAEPWGLILFARNCETPGQIAALAQQFRDCVGRENAPVLIDQEGGRVQRLGPPTWRKYPAARAFGDIYRRDPAHALKLVGEGARLMAGDLHDVGITINCLPVADVPQPGAHDIIGDRAYSADVQEIAELARAAAEGSIAGGVLPVVKHIPGHGRASVDSHIGLPVVTTDAETLSEVDFAAFAALKDLPIAMTAHVIYTAFDEDRPATLSPIVIKDVIREEIGFSGLLLTDDLSMGALSGSLSERTEAAFDAGCDIALHCNGQLAEMEAVAAATPLLDGEALVRSESALGRYVPPDTWETAELVEELAILC